MLADKPRDSMAIIDILHPLAPTAALVKAGLIQAFAAPVTKNRPGICGRSWRLSSVTGPSRAKLRWGVHGTPPQTIGCLGWVD